MNRELAQELVTDYGIVPDEDTAKLRSNAMANEKQTTEDMPRWKCHKVVRALQIRQIDLLDHGNGGAKIHFRDDQYLCVTVSKEYLQKHRPIELGYYVVYEDGYESWSPQKAFESGYTLIRE